jgi:hypothetical protein
MDLKYAANIRNLYSPVQPAVNQAGSGIMYREVLPDVALQPFIYCYWELKTTQPLAQPYIYRVVADGCIDIYFEAGNPNESYVMGFCRKYTEFPLDTSFHYFGVRFLPAMFPLLFKIDASEFSNCFLKLADLVPHLSLFIDGASRDNPTQDYIRKLLDSYFIRHISKNDFDPDNRFFRSMNIILKNSGVLNVQSDLDTGISPRQLRRLFDFYIGDNVKTFSKVVRFQNILRAKPSTQSLRINKLFFDVGFYDQSHFIKDFTNFYGVTPGRAFGR